MPPLTPRATRTGLLRGGRRLRRRFRLRPVPLLDDLGGDLFLGDHRRLGRLRVDAGDRAHLELLRAQRGEHHEAVLALDVLRKLEHAGSPYAPLMGAGKVDTIPAAVRRRLTVRARSARTIAINSWLASSTSALTTV